MSATRHIWLAAACALAVFWAPATPSQHSFSTFGGEVAMAQTGGKSLEDVQSTINFVRKQIDSMEERYLQPELISTKFTKETRFNDARVAHELQQYDRAAFLFLDVISKSDASFAGWRASHFLLADSLIKLRNFIGARNYLRELIRMGPGEYYQQALAKLLEVAYMTDDYEDIEEVYDRLDTNTAQAPALAYLRGKTLFEQERYGDARQFFLRASKSPEFDYKGRYYAAVALVSQGELQAAYDEFAKLVETVPEEEGDRRIYALSYLSMGRVAYEQQNYEEAIDLYNRLSRDDPEFVNAMYESAWANVQLEKFEQAGRVIDILIQAEPDPETYTRALLLKADLALRIDDYERALGAYETVLERYDPVKAQLDQFATKHDDLQGFFRGLVREDLTLEIPEGLPSIRTDFKTQTPEEWLAEDEQLSETRQMVEDVSVAQANLESAYEDLAQIEARLNSGGRIKSFPKIAEGIAVVTELESQLIGAQRALMKRQAELIAPKLSGADAERWSQLEEETDLLATRYAVIPKTADELKEREEQVARDFGRLRKILNEVSYDIDQKRAEMAAIETYIQTQELRLSEEERAQVRELKAEINATIAKLEEQQRKLRAQIATAREQIGTGDVIGEGERGLRSLYSKKLAEASDFLYQRRRLASNASELSRIDGLRGQIPPLTGRIEAYYTKMDTVVEEKTVDMRKTIDNLRVVLGEQSEELSEVAIDSQKVAGDIALKTFLNKREQLDGVILRADVGKIDVLYQRKEDVTQEINGLFQERTNELRQLQESFDEVR